MRANDFMLIDTEIWVRLIALEKKWDTPRDEVLTRALHECRGVGSELNATLKAWLHPNPGDLQREAERLFGEGGWTIWRKTDA